MLRMLALGVPVLAIGYMAMPGGGYSRVVDRPPGEVAAALADLDIREQPGSPGTDASRSGGILPVFSHQRSADAVTFIVASGDKTAVRMIAHLEPVDGGKRTRVTASVERGDAPDDFVSPAFRSRGITMGLFTMAIESELDELTAPVRKAGAETCEKLIERFQASALASEDLQRRDGIKDAMGDTASAVMRIAALQQEARRLGCDTGASHAFKPVSNRMGEAGPAPRIELESSEGEGVTYKPGEPMLDPDAGLR
ncbi:hypothetical protein [Sphingomonas sp.]|uniref:hypothetical protein n=1 Tax=Sphingomonas sp. TaxID=28214 RepID=UPI0031D8CC1F